MSQTGSVKFFNIEKGFGFITPDTGGNDVFIHVSTLHSLGLKSLIDQQKVIFDIDNNSTKGPKATNIQIISE